MFNLGRQRERTGYRSVCQARLHARITRRLIDKNEMKSLLKGNLFIYNHDLKPNYFKQEQFLLSCQLPTLNTQGEQFWPCTTNFSYMNDMPLKENKTQTPKTESCETTGT